MININSVRETVLAILNKEERGYLAPDEFNRFAKQAQLEIFESYFQDIQHFAVSRKGEVSDEGYSDAVENLSEKIDMLSEYTNSVASVPASTTTTQSFTGATGTTAFTLSNDATSVSSVTVGGTATTNFTFTAPTTITFDAQSDAPNNSVIVVTYTRATNTFTLPSNHYRLDSVFHRASDGTLRAVSEIEKKDIAYVLGSPLRQPSTVFPKYQRISDDIVVLPNTITSGLEIHYIRKPIDPIWNFQRLGTARVPAYNPTTSVNFELHPSDEYKLVETILLYAGTQLRQPGIVSLASED